MRNVVCIVSLVLNVLAAAFFIFAASQKEKAFVSFENRERHTAAVCVVSVPEGASVVFGPVELALRPGEEGFVQFSAVLSKNNQINIALDPLYDRDIVDLRLSPWGLRVKALKPGETVLQTLTPEGIRDVAVVTVAE